MTGPAHDWDLLRDYVERNSQEAFRQLVSAHVDMAALRQLRDRELAEEVTQAAFVLLARKAASLRHQTVLPAWLHKTVRYLAMNAMKLEHRRRFHERKAAEMADDIRRIDQKWQKVEPMLDEGIASLADRDRAAIMLRFFEQRSLADVGEALGVSEDAAGMRVSRAIDKLRTYFYRRGAILSVAGLGVILTANAVQAAPPALAGSIASAAMSAAGAAGTSAFALALANSVARMMAWAKVKAAAALFCGAVLAFGLAWIFTDRLLNHPPVHTDPTPVAEYRR